MPESRIDFYQLLQTVYLHQLVDVLIRIGIRGRILVLHLRH